MSTQTWHVIGRGFNGWHATGINVRSSGGDLMPYTYWTGAACAGYAAEAVEGALVYDAKHLRDDQDAALAFVKHVVTGPMLKPELTEDEGQTAFSFVTVKTFESLLRQIPGIKIGRVINGNVVWE